MFIPRVLVALSSLFIIATASMSLQATAQPQQKAEPVYSIEPVGQATTTASVLLQATAQPQQKAEPPKPEVYFIEPADQATLSNPITIKFGLKNMGVSPAGLVKENTGHHHLIINAELPNLKFPIPTSANYIHFGGGQTEVTMELSRGKHQLQLLLGNTHHIPHQPPLYSSRITIYVE